MNTRETDIEESLQLSNVSQKNGTAIEHSRVDISEGNICSRTVSNVSEALTSFLTRHKAWIKRLILIVLLLAYISYFIYAIYYRFGDEGSYRLVGYTVVGALCIFNYFSWDYLCKCFAGILHSKAVTRNSNTITILKWALYIAIFTIVVVTLIYVVLESPRNLVSLGGLVVFLILTYLTSRNPARVQWQTVIVGLLLQYFFGLFILKTDIGRLTFTWFGERVTEVLQNTDAGTRFVFGESYLLHPMAFQAFPVMIFVSSILSVLYYVGIMQKLINGFGRFLGFFLITTPAESICASGSIFLGVGEVLLLVKPFVSDMTVSEIAAVITSSLSTMMGSILALCISLGIPARHLIAASVMSAPAALVISKISVPETEKTKATGDYYTVKSMGTEKNIIEALSSGASASITLIANLVVTLISFLAVVEFVNSCLLWAGHRVGVDGLSFEFVCSYVLFPAAFLMGVDIRDCKKVAELLGIKLCTLSMNAYIKMIPLLNNRKILTKYASAVNNTEIWEWRGDNIYLPQWNQTLSGGIFHSERSDVIATYALCGFSNFGTLGTALAVMTAMAPERRGDIASIGLRCIWASNIACIVTACIAGLLYEENS